MTQPTTYIGPYPIIRLSSTDSTNNYARELILDKEFQDREMVVTADFQASGKGQRGNSWESQEGRNLLLSIVLHPKMIPARMQFLLSEIISLSAVEAYDPYADGFSVKWPNDIYHKDRKIAGILIENTLQGTCLDTAICGIGMNVNQESFVSDAPNPVSLRQIIGHETDREEVLGRFLGKVQEKMSRLRSEDFESVQKDLHDQFKARLFRKEGFHSYRDKDGEFEARILDILPDGPLVLMDESGRKRSYLFKEVQYILQP